MFIEVYGIFNKKLLALTFMKEGPWVLFFQKKCFIRNMPLN